MSIKSVCECTCVSVIDSEYLIKTTGGNDPAKCGVHASVKGQACNSLRWQPRQIVGSGNKRQQPRQITTTQIKLLKKWSHLVTPSEICELRWDLQATQNNAKNCNITSTASGDNRQFPSSTTFVGISDWISPYVFYQGRIVSQECDGWWNLLLWTIRPRPFLVDHDPVDRLYWKCI